MLVIAPPLVITDEEIDMVLDYLRQAIKAAMVHFNR
jgi:4-aminobutyrate aminotransferase-like enzyme